LSASPTPRAHWLRAPAAGRALPNTLAALLLATAGLCPARAAAAPIPVSFGHAHNDYLHARPLANALQAGFPSVEADIHLVDGALLVAHDLELTRSDRTLQSLYLDPLRARAASNQGRILPDGAVFILLIDIKSEADSTYQTLAPVLEQYRDILTRFTPDSTHTNSVTVILSGNRPLQRVAQASERFAAIDGRLSDLDSLPSLHVMPLISDRWSAHFQWAGEGALPAEEAAKLEAWVQAAHRQGRWLRFWAIPDHEQGWRVMRQAGVNLINTDRLNDLQRFLADPAPTAK
jgi:hypothetical protein